MKRLSKQSLAKSAFVMSLCAVLLSICTFTGSFNTNSYEASPKVMEASVFNSGSTYSQNATTISDEIAEEKSVIPLGTAFGIKLFTDGVIIASITDIKSGDSIICPAKDAGLEAGDYILAANGNDVSTNSSLAKMIGASNGEGMELTVKREDEIFTTVLTPIFSEGSFKAGMWIRDSAAGIGTLTFYDPDTQMFAGLGHGICDIDTHSLMSMESGEPAEIALCGIIKGKSGEPGQLQGYFASDTPMGTLVENNDTGVYGRLTETPDGTALPVAKRSEIVCTDAEILVSINGEGPQRYKISIDRILSESTDTKNMVIRITDERLLELTGGIVQGMSGAPIIQNEKIVGAVTHVFTDDPTTGYGIFAETMCAKSVTYSMSE